MENNAAFLMQSLRMVNKYGLCEFSGPAGLQRRGVQRNLIFRRKWGWIDHFLWKSHDISMLSFDLTVRAQGIGGRASVPRRAERDGVRSCLHYVP